MWLRLVVVIASTNVGAITLFSYSAYFFIDENFRIVKAHYGKHLDDKVSIEELKTFAGI